MTGISAKRQLTSNQPHFCMITLKSFLLTNALGVRLIQLKNHVGRTNVNGFRALLKCSLRILCHKCGKLELSEELKFAGGGSEGRWANIVTWRRPKPLRLSSKKMVCRLCFHFWVGLGPNMEPTPFCSSSVRTKRVTGSVFFFPWPWPARLGLDLVGWLVGWLAGWLAGWLVGRLVGLGLLQRGVGDEPRLHHQVILTPFRRSFLLQSKPGPGCKSRAPFCF